MVSIAIQTPHHSDANQPLVDNTALDGFTAIMAILLAAIVTILAAMVSRGLYELWYALSGRADADMERAALLNDADERGYETDIENDDDDDDDDEDDDDEEYVYDAFGHMPAERNSYRTMYTADGQEVQSLED